MLEELYAYVLLLCAGMVSSSEYIEYIDTLFMQTPDNDLLLELEWSLSDTRKSIAIISKHCHECSIDYDLFGRFLFSKLEEVYHQNKMSIKKFGAKSHAIWRQFPNTICQTEPFWTLCYADDPLSWDDETQTRELYEIAFRFYINS